MMTHKLLLIATLAAAGYAVTSTAALAVNLYTAAGLASAPLSDVQTVDTRSYQHCHHCYGSRGRTEIRCHRTGRRVCPEPQPRRPGQT
jgi:hypothetical protein